MVFVRFISLILIVLALMLLGADFVTTLEQGGAFMVRSLATALSLVGGDPSAWLEATLPSIVSGALVGVLSWPSWAVMGVIGVILSLISGRKDA